MWTRDFFFIFYFTEHIVISNWQISAIKSFVRIVVGSVSADKLKFLNLDNEMSWPYFCVFSKEQWVKFHAMVKVLTLTMHGAQVGELRKKAASNSKMIFRDEVRQCKTYPDTGTHLIIPSHPFLTFSNSIFFSLLPSTYVTNKSSYTFKYF